MGDEKTRRVNDALSSLVDLFIPLSQEEDEVLDKEKLDNGVELARSIIEGQVSTTLIRTSDNI